MTRKPILYIWGAGKLLAKAMKTLIMEECEIVGLVDRKFETIKTYDGIPAYSPKILRERGYDYILITVKHSKSIEDECKEMDIPSEKIIRLWMDSLEKFNFIDYKEVAIILKDWLIEKLQIRLKNAPFEYMPTHFPIIKGHKELFKKMQIEHNSLCRFGDSEFEIMRMKPGAWYQRPNKQLAQRLSEVMTSPMPNLCIAIPDIFSSLAFYTEEAADSIRSYITGGSTRNDILNLLPNDIEYYNAYVSRCYMMYVDKTHSYEVFGSWKKVWENRDICVIEGYNARIGMFNDLFNKCTNIKRIVCPETDAFHCYNDIYHNVLEYARQDELILISLGATATVLAFDLSKKGYQAIDIGQLDNEYDWFNINATERKAIYGKMVAEVSWGHTPEDIVSPEYSEQIVCVIKG